MKTKAMFKGITNEAFRQYFQTDEDCLKYLAELKWKEGYCCRRCGCEQWWKGRMYFDRRCQLCGYNESPTSGTLFHKLKISLLTAFEMCYLLAVRKKRRSSCELGRCFGMQQKSAWYFKRKVQEAMKSSWKFPLEGRVEVHEFVLGGKEKGNQGRAKGRRKIVILGVEKVNGNRGLGRA